MRSRRQDEGIRHSGLCYIIISGRPFLFDHIFRKQSTHQSKSGLFADLFHYFTRLEHGTFDSKQPKIPATEYSLRLKPNQPGESMQSPIHCNK
jgi:hypothetical protein